MAHDKPIPASMLKEYVTVSRPTTVEDEYGDLTVASETTFSFWGDIKETKPSVTREQGKPRQTRVVEILARERDVESIDLKDELSFGNSDDTFIVIDFFQADWKWGTIIMAEYTD